MDRQLFSTQDTQLAFAVLTSASCTEQETSNNTSIALQPLLVRQSSSSAASCPLLIALRDLILRRDQHSHNAGAHGTRQVDSAHALISEQLRQYETDLRQAEQQCNPLKIARDKLKAELQRVETLLHNAETEARKASDGVLVCKSLLQSLQSNSDRGFDPAQVVALSGAMSSNAAANLSSSVSLTAPQQHQPQHNHQQYHHLDPVAAATPAIPSVAQRQQNNQSGQQQGDPSAAMLARQQQQQQQQLQQQQSAAASAAGRSGSAQLAPTAAAAPVSAASPVAVSIEHVCEMLRSSGRAGTDAEFREQLLPALAVIQRRLTRAGSVLDPATHGALATVLMTPAVAGALHERVQIHAFRAILAMIKKAAETPLTDQQHQQMLLLIQQQQQPQQQNSHNPLILRLRAAGLQACYEENGLRGFIAIFANSDDDDVKAEVLECLGAFVSESGSTEACCSLGVVPPLVHLIATSTSEPVLERALLLFWALASGSERVREEAHQSNCVPALCQLLYTDSHPIMINTLIALGYLSRDDKAKAALAEHPQQDGGSGLEKIVSCLYHSSATVMNQAAGVLWNCATREQNRGPLMQLGAVPALLQMLRKATASEIAKENISGALWNLSVDASAKRELADFEGLQLLVNLLKTSTSENILENATGTLWNCSASMDNRASLRRHGALPLILNLLQHASYRIQENAAGTIRNLVINDHCKVAMRECGGIEALLEKMRTLWAELNEPMNQQHHQQQHASASTITSILDRLIASLWILTVSPENRGRLQPSFQLLLDCAASPMLVPGTREKVVGVLRHCCQVPEVRRPLAELGAFNVMVDFAASLGLALPTATLRHIAPHPAPCSVTLRENIAFIMWNLAREDRERGRIAGALGVVTYLLGDDNDIVVEFAAGAVSALINSSTNEGRNDLADMSGVTRLCNAFANVSSRLRGGGAGNSSSSNNNNSSSATASSSSSSSSSNAALIVLLYNCLRALRYATSVGCERNIAAALDHDDVVGRLIALVDAPVQGVAGGAIGADDVMREVMLLLRNLITSSDVRAAHEKEKVSAALRDRLPAIMTTAASTQGDAASMLQRAVQALSTAL